MQFFSINRTKTKSSATSLIRVMVIVFVLLLIFIFYPKIVQAGLFSFLSDLAGDEVSAKTTEGPDSPNSQNMALLKAAVNTDPNPNKSLGYSPLVSGNALLAEIGPSGTHQDVEEQANQNAEISLYVVRPGDTLSQIAEMFDVSVNTIVWANDISRNAPLKEGQNLIILPITGIRHKVVKGQTIGSIVKKYKADLEEVLQYNDLTSNSKLVEGQTIIIPDAELTVVASTPKSVSSSSVVSESYFKRPIKTGKKTQGLHGHNGVDLADAIGTPIYAAAAGTVIASLNNGAWNGGYGNYVIISHSNGTQSLYSHNSENLVKVGQYVKQGQEIAKMGATGRATGPHVHFEIRGARNPF